MPRWLQIEGRLALDHEVHGAAQAADRPQQDVLGEMIGGHSPVGARPASFTAPGPDEQHVSLHRPPGCCAPCRLEHHRPGQVSPARRHRHVCRSHPEQPAVAIQDRGKDAGRIHPRHAQPLDIAARGDERARLAVRDEAIVGYRRKGAPADGRVEGLRCLDRLVGGIHSPSPPCDSLRGDRRVGRSFTLEGDQFLGSKTSRALTRLARSRPWSPSARSAAVVRG